MLSRVTGGISHQPKFFNIDINLIIMIVYIYYLRLVKDSFFLILILYRPQCMYTSLNQSQTVLVSTHKRYYTSYKYDTSITLVCKLRSHKPAYVDVHPYVDG